MTHIVITGASSGIGEALALEYATSGTLLSICGRNQERLDQVAEKCRAKGALVEARVLDVLDRKAMCDWLLTAHQSQPIDILIANAGVSGGSSPEINWVENMHQVFDTNIQGVTNTVMPIVPEMIKCGRGQIALVSSLAGFRAMSAAPAYSTTKVAVKAYGEALRLRYKKDGVKVNVICPGFVKSRITDQNDFHMPMLWPADKAAQVIRQGLERNKAVISFPGPMAFGARLFAALPLWLVEILSARMPAKE